MIADNLFKSSSGLPERITPSDRQRHPIDAHLPGLHHGTNAAAQPQQADLRHPTPGPFVHPVRVAQKPESVRDRREPDERSSRRYCLSKPRF